MKKLFFTVILASTLFAFVCSVNAFFPRGRINENYSYDNLRIEKVEAKGRGKDKHYLEGTIINETDRRVEDVRIKFYAMTIHDKTLWRVTVKVDFIDPYGKFQFSKKIKRYKEETPYKWEFKVKEPKRK